MKRTDSLFVASADVARAMRWSIGQAVTVLRDDGSLLLTETASAPWKHRGTWVILLECAVGAPFWLARVRER